MALQAKESRGPWLWPLLITAAGVVLLLDNFLLLGDFRASGLWPLALVVAGAQILVRGDIIPSASARNFGITRGSVESGTLEISAGEIDVEIRDLQREGRLIAGQYAGESRPRLQVNENHAHLRMNRAETSWLSFVDWQMGLARDLPWQLFISTSLGQVNIDLSALIVQDATIATGIGDIRVVAPQEAFAPIVLRSSLGTIQVVTPIEYNTRIAVKGSRIFNVHVDETRYREVEPGVYASLDAADQPSTDITVIGTFGDAYLA